MRLTHPTLCNSIMLRSSIWDIFSTQMLRGCDHRYLQLLATTIAAENADTQLDESLGRLEQIQNAQDQA